MKMLIVLAAILAILGVVSFVLNFREHRILGIVFFIIATVIALVYFLRKK